MESYVKFIITCGNEGEKGIHIRNASENQIIKSSVIVEPVFLNEGDIGKSFNQLFNNIKYT